LADALTRLNQPLEMAQGSMIRVSSMLHPGVVIRFPVGAATVQTTLRGPVTIRLTREDGQPLIAAYDEHNNVKARFKALEQSAST
jgi:hypothetical protein